MPLPRDRSKGVNVQEGLGSPLVTVVLRLILSTAPRPHVGCLAPGPPLAYHQTGVKELWKDTDSPTKPLSSDGARAVDPQRRQQPLEGWSPLLRPRAYPAVESGRPGTCGPPVRSLQTRTRVSFRTCNKPSGPGALPSLWLSSEEPMDMLRRRFGRRVGVWKRFG